MALVLAVLSVASAGTVGLNGSAFAQAKKKAAKAAVVSDQPSAVLERALKLYDSKEYDGASIELFKVVEGESGDNEANQQKAEFFMGKTLFNMKFHSASLSYFDRIVQKGASHAFYNETLKWLASLSQELADASGVLEKIGKYQRADLDQPALESVRDQLYFLLGRFNYNKSNFKEAVALFQTVPSSSKYYVQAKLFEGATHVREYDGKAAAESFKEVLRAAAISKSEEDRPYVDLANLSLARTFYSTRQYDLAVKYYDRVSTDSYDWPNSLFEASWANFMLKQAGYPKALGNIHTLQAPYFENFVKPESVAEALTVKATIYFYNCLYDRAKDSIDEFNEKIPELAQDLKKVLDSAPANDAFFDVAEKIRKGKSGLDKNVERAAKAVLSDRSLSKKFDFVRQLDSEITRFDKSDAAWKSTAVANAVYTDLTLQRSLSVNDAGDLARQRVTRLVGELAQLIKRVIKIEYEILQGQKGTLEQEVAQEQQSTQGGKARDISNIRVDDEHEYWPFVGEYWRDELGYYRVRLVNKCDKSAPEGAPTGPTE